MKEYRFGEGGFSKFIAGKGFYVALAVCLVGAAAAAWITVGKTLESITGQEQVPVAESSQSSSAPQSSEPAKKPGAASSARTVERDEPGESLPTENEEADPAESAQAEMEQEPEDEAFWPFTEKVTYALPVEGEIIQDHSNGELVKNETLGEWRTHDGIDIKCAVGTDICAPADGKVTRVWSDPMWGECVELEHADGVSSTVCGLDKEITVKEGDELKRGDVIGKLGETNSAEIGADSHLHFAMKKDGKFADPLAIMGME